MTTDPRRTGTIHVLDERRLQRRAALHGTALQDPAERRLDPHRAADDWRTRHTITPPDEDRPGAVHYFEVPPEDGIFPDWPLALIAAGVILLLYGVLRWLS